MNRLLLSLFQFFSGCTPHLHHDIIDTAFNLLTCASKEVMRLKSLVAFSQTELLRFVPFAPEWPVVELTMPCVQSLVNLIIQTPRGASYVSGSLSANLLLGSITNHRADLYCPSVWSSAHNYNTTLWPSPWTEVEHATTTTTKRFLSPFPSHTLPCCSFDFMIKLIRFYPTQCRC